MGNKQIYLFSIIIVLLVIIQFGFVSAEMLVSDAGVEYEERILEEFSKLEGTNETFVKVIIHLENLSEADNLVSDFSKDELKNVINRDIPNRSSQSFGATISQDGFFKLLKDGRVTKVYYNAPIKLIDRPWQSKSFKISLILAVILIVLIFILIKIYKKSKKRK